MKTFQEIQNDLDKYKDLLDDWNKRSEKKELAKNISEKLNQIEDQDVNSDLIKKVIDIKNDNILKILDKKITKDHITDDIVNHVIHVDDREGLELCMEKNPDIITKDHLEKVVNNSRFFSIGTLLNSDKFDIELNDNVDFRRNIAKKISPMGNDIDPKIRKKVLKTEDLEYFLDQKDNGTSLQILKINEDPEINKDIFNKLIDTKNDSLIFHVMKNVDPKLIQNDHIENILEVAKNDECLCAGIIINTANKCLNNENISKDNKEKLLKKAQKIVQDTITQGAENSYLLKQISPDIKSQVIKEEDIMKAIINSKNPDSFNSLLQNIFKDGKVPITEQMIQEVKKLPNEGVVEGFFVAPKKKDYLKDDVLHLMMKSDPEGALKIAQNNQDIKNDLNYANIFELYNHNPQATLELVGDPKGPIVYGPDSKAIRHMKVDQVKFSKILLDAAKYENIEDVQQAIRSAKSRTNEPVDIYLAIHGVQDKNKDFIGGWMYGSKQDETTPENIGKIIQSAVNKNSKDETVSHRPIHLITPLCGGNKMVKDIVEQLEPGSTCLTFSDEITSVPPKLKNIDLSDLNKNNPMEKIGNLFAGGIVNTDDSQKKVLITCKDFQGKVSQMDLKTYKSDKEIPPEIKKFIEKNKQYLVDPDQNVSKMHSANQDIKQQLADSRKTFLKNEEEEFKKNLKTKGANPNEKTKIKKKYDLFV